MIAMIYISSFILKTNYFQDGIYFSDILFDTSEVGSRYKNVSSIYCGVNLGFNIKDKPDIKGILITSSVVSHHKHSFQGHYGINWSDCKPYKVELTTENKDVYSLLFKYHTLDRETLDMDRAVVGGLTYERSVLDEFLDEYGIKHL